VTHRANAKRRWMCGLGRAVGTNSDRRGRGTRTTPSRPCYVRARRWQYDLWVNRAGWAVDRERTGCQKRGGRVALACRP
jgi:hypothetical protein